jgi:hypothetical protein
VAVHGVNELVAIDPAAMKIIGRLSLPGIKNPHGIALDLINRFAFVAGEENHSLAVTPRGVGKSGGSASRRIACILTNGINCHKIAKARFQMVLVLETWFALLATIDPISRSRTMVKSALTTSPYLFSLCL